MDVLPELVLGGFLALLIYLFATYLVRLRHKANKEQAEPNAVAFTTQVDNDIEMLVECLSDRVAPIVGDDDHIKEVLLAQMIPELKKYVSLMDITEYDGTHIKIMILNVACQSIN